MPLSSYFPSSPAPLFDASSIVLDLRAVNHEGELCHVVVVVLHTVRRQHEHGLVAVVIDLAVEHLDGLIGGAELEVILLCAVSEGGAMRREVDRM